MTTKTTQRQGCTCDRVRKGEPYDAARDCKPCWLYWHNAEHHRRKGGPGDVIPVRDKITRFAVCKDLGPKVDPACACIDRVCLAGKGVVRHTEECQTCDAYQRPGTTRALPPGPPVGRRHLVYFVLPVAGNGVWRRGVDQLRLRWQLFTGRKVVAVATSGGPVQLQHGGRTAVLDTLDAVRAYLPADAEVIEVPQDPGRWELQGWPHLWERALAGADPADAVLYCHAKGVTRPTTITREFGGTAQHWAQLLYTLALDYWPAVEAEFRRGCPIVGPLRKPGTFFGGREAAGMRKSQWHYSGNFWWARAGDFKTRWPRVPVPDDPWGPEAWVGIAYRLEEAGLIGPPVDPADPYSAEWWDTVLTPAYVKWCEANRPTSPAELATVRLSIILPTQGRPSLGRTLASITPQLAHGDELIVERDSSGDWGHTPRNRAIASATGDYLLFMDDDDVYEPGALAAIRAAVAENPGRPHLFRMRRGPFGDTLWTDREVREGNVSTQMIAFPNDKARLGRWGVRYQGDLDFITSTLAKYPADAIVWRPEIIATWRPG